MPSFDKNTYNPVDLINSYWGESLYTHIIYDPKLKGYDYCIVRQSKHDGTFMFIKELIRSSLEVIVNQRSYCTKNEPDWDKLKGINYTVGSVKHSTCYGLVELGADKRKHLGQSDRVRIPVKCKYDY